MTDGDAEAPSPADVPDESPDGGSGEPTYGVPRDSPAGVPRKTSVLGHLLQVLMVLELMAFGVSWLWGWRFGQVLGQPPVQLVVICCVGLVGLPAAVYFALVRAGKAHHVSLLLLFAAVGTLAAARLPSLYNCAADKGPIQVYRTRVVDIAPSGAEESWVDVESWVRPGETVELDAGSAYHSLALNSKVEVGVKPGALGAPWVASFRIIREPTPLFDFDPIEIRNPIEIPALEATGEPLPAPSSSMP